MRFSEYYFYRAAELRRTDLAILSTANTFDERPSNYDRFAVILDRRFEDWLAAEALAAPRA